MEADKRFGFGKHALLSTFIHPYLYSKATKLSKTGLKQQQSLMFIVAITLLLSGDIHQCPGPNNIPVTEGRNINNRSTTANLQVCTLRTLYSTPEQTHLLVQFRPPCECRPGSDARPEPDSRRDETAWSMERGGHPGCCERACSAPSATTEMPGFGDGDRGNHHCSPRTARLAGVVPCPWWRSRSSSQRHACSTSKTTNR
uniref:Uncharacterized protein n=1 Tax=Knipowitschia caucasica TaxID=637954 RepID=A0AAV2LPA0_KNICA